MLRGNAKTFSNFDTPSAEDQPIHFILGIIPHYATIEKILRTRLLDNIKCYKFIEESFVVAVIAVESWRASQVLLCKSRERRQE